MTNDDNLSWSVYRRLRTVKGEDWWADHDAPSNGIGPVCLFCSRLIDWGPRDHSVAPLCPVRRFYGWEIYEDDADHDPFS